MAPFKKASELNKNYNARVFPPEIRDVIIKHLKTFKNPVTVTSTLIELNKYGLNPSRSVVRKHLDELAKAGAVSVTLNKNVYEFSLNNKE